MDNSSVLQASVLRFGVFELDCRAGELRKSGVLVHLPPQPFNVLALLASHSGQIVTRESIRRQVWGDETYVDFERGLNQCVSQIRTALGDDAEAPRYVETLARRGYRFLAPVERIDSKSSPTENGDLAERTLGQASSRGWALVAVGMLGGVIITFVAMHLMRPPETEQHMIQFSISPPQNTEFRDFALSPDGRKLAFVAWGPGTGAWGQLWVRPIDSLVAQPLQGTDGAQSPFWSPDSGYLGFFAVGKLKKIAVPGGPVQALCDAEGPGGTWSRQGVILFSSNDALYRVPDPGGEPTLVAAPDTARLERSLLLPQFLPDGSHFLFYGLSASRERNFIGVGSLDSKQSHRLLSENSSALYSPQGYLFYVHQRTLVARRFDAGQLRFTGEAVPIAQYAAAGLAIHQAIRLSISDDRILVYKAGLSAATSRMVWFDRNGKELGTVGPLVVYSNPALSPDGTRLAVGEGFMGPRDIWVYDLRRNTGSRLTRSPTDDLNPVWSHDGSTIMFTSTPQGQRDLYERSSNGLGPTRLVYASKEQAKSLMDWSPDGRYALYETDSSPDNLWALPLFGERKPFAVERNSSASQARFSPDGRYIAYASDETGQNEVYVQTFPQHLGKWTVSTSGGTEPMWRRDGKELFYLKGNDTVMSVDVSTGTGGFKASIANELFKVQMVIAGWRNRYVVSPDGQRFLILVPAVDANPEPINVVLNWPALLKNAGK